MSVAKNTLVSGSCEKSLEIMVLRLPPQAARTNVCGYSSRRASSSRRFSALPLRPNSCCGLRLSPASDAPSTYTLSSHSILTATYFIDIAKHLVDPTADHQLYRS